MKKSVSIIALVMVIVLCFSLYSCGGENEGGETIEDKVWKAAESSIQGNLYIQYGVTAQSITHFITKKDLYNYVVTGKITVRDNYGDTYTGKYQVDVTYDSTDGKCHTKNTNIEKLYKN